MRRTRVILFCLVVALAVCAGPALAEEILFFTNGTSMPIVRHEVRGDMIHVDLGSEATMAFPMRQVEKIEQAGKEVSLRASSGSGNRIIQSGPPDPHASYPTQGVEPSRFSTTPRQLAVERAAENPDVEVDEMGTAVYRPFSHSRSRGKQMVGAAGNRRVLDGGQNTPGGYTGAKQLGSRHVIGSRAPSNYPAGRKSLATGFAQKPASQSGGAPANSGDGSNSNNNGSQSQSSSSDSGSGD